MPTQGDLYLYTLGAGEDTRSAPFAYRPNRQRAGHVCGHTHAHNHTHYNQVVRTFNDGMIADTGGGGGGAAAIKKGLSNGIAARNSPPKVCVSVRVCAADHGGSICILYAFAGRLSCPTTIIGGAHVITR